MFTSSRQSLSNFYEETEAYTATPPNGGRVEFQIQFSLYPPHIYFSIIHILRNTDTR